jgi:hypothetical protein
MEAYVAWLGRRIAGLDSIHWRCKRYNDDKTNGEVFHSLINKGRP